MLHHAVRFLFTEEQALYLETLRLLYDAARDGEVEREEFERVPLRTFRRLVADARAGRPFQCVFTVNRQREHKGLLVSRLGWVATEPPLTFGVGETPFRIVVYTPDGSDWRGVVDVHRQRHIPPEAILLSETSAPGVDWQVRLRDLQRRLTTVPYRSQGYHELLAEISAVQYEYSAARRGSHEPLSALLRMYGKLKEGLL